MSKSIITDSLFKKAVDLVNSGYSVRKACDELNIPRTSFRRMVARKGGINLPTDIEYHVLLKSANFTFIIDGNFYTIDKGSAEYTKKKELIDSLITRTDYKMNLEEQAIIVDNNLNKTVRELIAKVDDLKIKDGKFYFKDKMITKDFFEILKVAAKKKNASNIKKFADLLIENPDDNIIFQLHGFISHNDVEIDESGYVIAYKSVRYDWLDHHTRSISNKVGERPKMNRKDVDPNPNVTCSSGLHVGSMSYIMKLYNNSNNRIMVCRVHPKDFVSIPVDYNFAKARICEYEVIEELQ